MRGVLITALLLLLSAAFAAGAGKWEQAYNLDPGYRDAQRAAATAADDLAKVQANPDAAPLSLLRAHEKLDEAQAKLPQAKLSATTKALTAIGDVLAGRGKVAATTARLTLSTLQEQAAELRRQAGMISAQELARAKADQAQATTTQATAQRELLGAIARMKLYVDEAPDALSEPPSIDTEKLTLGKHPTLLAAQHRRNEAERALALAQGPDTAPLERSACERELHGAEDALQDAERTLNEALAAARRRYLAARENLKLTGETLRLAQKDLQSDQQRLQAGALSHTAVEEANAMALEADLAETNALVELWQAHIALLQAAGGEW